MKLNAYFFTFSDAYRHQPHPNTRSGITPHPDGFVTILAETEGMARDIAKNAIAPWLFQKFEKPSDLDYPRGNLTTIV